MDGKYIKKIIQDSLKQNIKIFMPLSENSEDIYCPNYIDMKIKIDEFIMSNSRLFNTEYILFENFLGICSILVYISSLKKMYILIRETISYQINTQKIDQMKKDMSTTEQIWDLFDDISGDIFRYASNAAGEQDKEVDSISEAEKKEQILAKEDDFREREISAINDKRDLENVRSQILNISNEIRGVYSDMKSLNQLISDLNVNFEKMSMEQIKKLVAQMLSNSEYIRNKLGSISTNIIVKNEQYSGEESSKYPIKERLPLNEFMNLVRDNLRTLTRKDASDGIQMTAKILSKLTRTIYTTNAQNEIDKYQEFIGESGVKIKRSLDDITLIISYLNEIITEICSDVFKKYGEWEIFSKYVIYNHNLESCDDIILTTINRYYNIVKWTNCPKDDLLKKISDYSSNSGQSFNGFILRIEQSETFHFLENLLEPIPKIFRKYDIDNEDYNKIKSSGKIVSGISKLGFSLEDMGYESIYYLNLNMELKMFTERIFYENMEYLWQGYSGESSMKMVELANVEKAINMVLGQGESKMQNIYHRVAKIFLEEYDKYSSG